MNCTNCPYKSADVHFNSNGNLSKAIEARLEEYGYSSGMYPDKYQSILAVRNTIKILVRGIPKGNKCMAAEVYQRALSELDRILPPKGDTSHA